MWEDGTINKNILRSPQCHARTEKEGTWLRFIPALLFSHFFTSIFHFQAYESTPPPAAKTLAMPMVVSEQLLELN